MYKSDFAEIFGEVFFSEAAKSPNYEMLSKGKNAAYKYFDASFILSEDKPFRFLEIKLLTHSALILLYSLRLQPIALFMKNSLLFRLQTMILSSNSVSVLSLNFC